MRLEYKDIVFLPCFAHQANLCVADIFKSSPLYKIASSKAIAIVAYFTDNRNSSWIKKLHDEQKELYGKYYALIRPAQTRWNSYYFCFASLVHSKRALKVCFHFFSITIMILRENMLTKKKNRHSLCGIKNYPYVL